MGRQPYRLHGPEMQAPAWLPANAPGIHLAAGLRSNERCRSRRIPGMAARQIRQRCSRDSNSDRSSLASEFRDSVDACEPITLESTSPQRTLRSAPPENRRGASDGTTLHPPLGDALTNAADMGWR